MTQDDYFTLLSALLPPATYDASGERLGAELKAEASLLSELDTLIYGLLSVVDPDMATFTLPDFERVYALPDTGLSVQRRRERIRAAIAATGGLSREYFINLARAMGYTITIDEPDEPQWRWIVNVTGAPERVYYFRVDESSVGDRLEEEGDPALEALFQRLKPAHTECLFTYSEDAL